MQKTKLKKAEIDLLRAVLRPLVREEIEAALKRRLPEKTFLEKMKRK